MKRTQFYYKNTYDDTDDYTYIPRIEDFCSSCKYCREFNKEGNAGSTFIPDYYTYYGYHCTKIIDGMNVEVGDSQTFGHPKKCPILDEKLKEIQEQIDRDVENDRRYRRSLKCGNKGYKDICSVIGVECLVKNQQNSCRLFKPMK